MIDSSICFGLECTGSFNFLSILTIGHHESDVIVILKGMGHPSRYQSSELQFCKDVFIYDIV